MKTWWHYFPLLILSALIPFGAGLLPTLEWEGHYYGGGPVREWAINTMHWVLSDTAQAQLVAHFMRAPGIAEEYLLYLPFAFNASLLCVWLGFALGQSAISTNNWFITQKYNSQRKAAKQ